MLDQIWAYVLRWIKSILPGLVGEAPAKPAIPTKSAASKPKAKIEPIYDSDGYSQDGYNSLGFNRAGFDRKGYNEEGYDKDGFDRFGCDIDGYDCDGFDPDGIDREGCDRYGVQVVPTGTIKIDDIGKARKTYVYFIYAPEVNRLKIGISKAPNRRLNQLRAMSPTTVHLLGLAVGGQELESRLHSAFAPCLYTNEWFNVEDDLEEWLTNRFPDYWSLPVDA